MENEKGEQTQQEQTPLSLVERAEAAAARIEKAEEEIKVTEQKIQEERTRELLGGGTTGNIPQEKPKEETPQEYANRVMNNKVEVQK